jgi:hypothetical protein
MIMIYFFRIEELHLPISYNTTPKCSKGHFTGPCLEKTSSRESTKSKITLQFRLLLEHLKHHDKQEKPVQQLVLLTKPNRHKLLQEKLINANSMIMMI